MKWLANKIFGTIIILIALPAALYGGFRYYQSQNQLDEVLRSMGYLPLRPPSNFHNLAAIYAVDSNLQKFVTICSASTDDLKGVVKESPGAETIADQLSNIGYAASLSASDVAQAAGANKYLKRVSFKLTGVNLYEIELGNSKLIYDRIMSRPECDSEVVRNLAVGYVCQGQSLLQASATYQVDDEDITTVALRNNDNPIEVKSLIKEAVDAKSDIKLIEKGGSLTTGFALKYGIGMNPTCIAPKGARFARYLPKNDWQRFINFMKYKIIEPMLPST
jgi:hypothetical protein